MTRTAQRTDIHRPSAIQTSDYEFVACMTDRADADLSLLEERATLIGFMQRTGATYATHEHGRSCMVCGAGFLDYAVFHHAPTNKLVCMGMDCAAKMSMGVDAAFRSFKDRVKAGIEAKAGKAKAQAQLAERGLSTAWTVFSTDYEGRPAAEDIVTNDMVGKLVRYGSLSDKQWAYLAKLVAKIEARPAREAAREAAKEVKRATSQHVGKVGERRVFSLTVVSCPKYESQFGPLYINICDDENGNVVVYKGGKALGEKGATVTLKATIKAHGDRDGVAQTVINRPVEM